MAFVSRNPFARTELHRYRLWISSGSCSWCGSLPTTATHKGYLYQYEVQHDGGRTEVVSGLFCSARCMRADHGKE